MRAEQQLTGGTKRKDQMAEKDKKALSLPESGIEEKGPVRQRRALLPETELQGQEPVKAREVTYQQQAPWRNTNVGKGSGKLWGQIRETGGYDSDEEMFFGRQEEPAYPKLRPMTTPKTGAFRIGQSQTGAAMSGTGAEALSAGPGDRAGKQNKIWGFGKKKDITGMSVRDAANSFQKSADIYNYQVNDSETVWTDKHSLQGIGTLPDGTMVYGETTTPEEVRLAKMVRRQAESIHPEWYQEEIDWLARVTADEIFGKEGSEEKSDWIRNRKDPAYYEIPDVTEKIMTFLQDEENSQRINGIIPWPFTLFNFYMKVKNGSTFDLKNKPDYNQNDLFIFDGEIVSRDALGNIAYGYLSKVYNYPERVPFTGAGYAQGKAETDSLEEDWSGTLGDDPRDTVRVIQGMDLYETMHGIQKGSSSVSVRVVKPQLLKQGGR